MKKLISLLMSLVFISTCFNMNMFTAYGAEPSLSQVYGWYEAIHIEWANDSNAAGAEVSYKLSTESQYTAIDSELVRQNGSGGVADIVGITTGVYDINVTTSSGKTLAQSKISVARHDRSGYGHFGLSDGLGGYNNDGTPKSNAQIVYVTNATKNTVKLGSYTGISSILKNASSSSPLIVRIIGTIDTQTRDADGTKTTDINNGVVAISGLTDKTMTADSYFNMLDIIGGKNITVEGIGTDATIEKWGFTFSKCNSIEVRNLTFTKYPEDACSFSGSSSKNSSYKNFWVHNNYFKIGENKYDLTEEQDKHEGDGSSDFSGCRNITYSYNVFEKCHKTSLHGGSDSSLQYNSTWHHNYFNASSSRLPLTRQINLHSYNNYFYKGSKCIDARASAWVMAECNYFDNSVGILTTANSTYGDPIVKSLNNVYYNSSVSDKAGTVNTTTNRTLTINATAVTNTNKNPYPNFDTNPSIFYYDTTNNCSDVEYLTDANTAKSDALTAAGLMKTGAVLDAYAPAPVEDTTEITTIAPVSEDSERFDKMELLIEQMLQEDGPENGSLWNKENTSAFKWSYINGCMASAILQLYDTKKDESYKIFADNYMSPFIGTSATSSKGYIADNSFKISNYTLDDLNSGKALIELIALGSENSNKYTNAVSDTLIEKSLNYQLHNQITSDGNLWHKKAYPYQVWLDSIYMETPFWLEYELEIGNNADNFVTAANHVTNQIQTVYDKLRSKTTGLYYHGYDAQADSSCDNYNPTSAMNWAVSGTGHSSSYWLRGTGWYAMALVDNIELMQKAEKKFNIDLTSQKNSITSIYNNLMNVMLKYQDSNTKLWYQVIDHPVNDSYNYLETSGSAAMSYALMKGYNIGIANISFYEKGLETFRGICDNKLLYTTDSKTAVDLKDICQTAGLAGPSSGATSSSATIGPNHNLRDGSYDYYVSEKTVTNDAKGVAPLIFAYCQILKYNNDDDLVTETSTEATTKTETTTSAETTTETTTSNTSHVGESLGSSGETYMLLPTDFSSGTPTSSQTSKNGVFTISPGKLSVNSGYINLGGGGDFTKNNIAVKVTGQATLTIKYFNSSTRTLETKSSDGAFLEQAQTTTGSSESKPDMVTYSLPKADTYYIYSTSGGIRVMEVTVTYPTGNSILIGDVDLNGTINAADAALLLRHISNIVTLTDEKQLTAGDCNIDNNHNMLDVIAILKYISK